MGGKICIKLEKGMGKRLISMVKKIAIAIKKGFDSVTLYDEIEEETKPKYNAKDIQKVYQGVIKKIDKNYQEEHY